MRRSRSVVSPRSAMMVTTRPASLPSSDRRTRPRSCGSSRMSVRPVPEARIAVTICRSAGGGPSGPGRAAMMAGSVAMRRVSVGGADSGTSSASMTGTRSGSATTLDESAVTVTGSVRIGRVRMPSRVATGAVRSAPDGGSPRSAVAAVPCRSAGDDGAGFAGGMGGGMGARSMASGMSGRVAALILAMTSGGRGSSCERPPGAGMPSAWPVPARVTRTAASDVCPPSGLVRAGSGWMA